MNDIPAEVWEQALAACPSHLFTPGVHFEVAHNATIQAIARAIKAERSRAAKTAHTWMHDNGLGANAADVAIEILKGEQQP